MFLVSFQNFKTAYNSYLVQPTDQTARHIHEIIEDLLKQDSSHASLIVAHIRKSDDPTATEKKLHQLIRRIIGPQLTDFPQDVLLEIFKNLDPQVMGRLAQVNKFLSNLVRNFFSAVDSKTQLALSQFLYKKQKKIQVLKRIELAIQCRHLLTTLNLCNALHLDEVVCEKIADNCVNLKELSFSGCLSTSDDCLAHISNLPKLEILDLQRCSKITDVGLQHIAKLSTLKHLNIVLCSKIKNFTQLSPNLLTLHLSDIIDLEPNAYSQLHKLLHLEQLFLRQQLRSLPLNHIADLNNLKELRFVLTTTTNVSHPMLQPLSNLKNLQRLEMFCGLDDQSIDLIATLTNLKWLKLSWNEIDTKNFEKLGKLSNLRHLEISNCDSISNDQIKNLSLLVNLEHLTLENCYKINNEGLKFLNSLNHLKSLTLTGLIDATDDGIKDYVLKLKNLKHLDLRLFGTITDEFIKCIAEQLHQLEHLNLSESDKVSEIGFSNLAKLGLKELIFSGCKQITAKEIEQMAKISTLQMLDLSRCKNIRNGDLDPLLTLNHLEQLNLRGCESLTQSNVITFLQIIKKKRNDLNILYNDYTFSSSKF